MNFLAQRFLTDTHKKFQLDCSETLVNIEFRLYQHLEQKPVRFKCRFVVKVFFRVSHFLIVIDNQILSDGS